MKAVEIHKNNSVEIEKSQNDMSMNLTKENNFLQKKTLFREKITSLQSRTYCIKPSVPPSEKSLIQRVKKTKVLFFFYGSEIKIKQVCRTQKIFQIFNCHLGIVRVVINLNLLVVQQMIQVIYFQKKYMNHQKIKTEAFLTICQVEYRFEFQGQCQPVTCL